ncbi:MAG: DUF1818 family protein [Prochlorococcaceae cyanobacterium]|jgi:hypothetical protein
MRVEDAQGWRLALEPARHPFVLLVGGAHWAAELRAREGLDLLEGIATLVRQHRDLADQLMAEEAITLEWERGALWVSLEGDRSGWDLRFVLTPADGQRALEGGWPAGAAAALAAALEPLEDGLRALLTPVATSPIVG